MNQGIAVRVQGVVDRPAEDGVEHGQVLSGRRLIGQGGVLQSSKAFAGAYKEKLTRLSLH